MDSVFGRALLLATPLALMGCSASERDDSGGSAAGSAAGSSAHGGSTTSGGVASGGFAGAAASAGSEPGGSAGQGGMPPGSAGAASGGGGAEGSVPALPAPSNTLCIFDYDLTLSSHQCPATEGNASYQCRTNVCQTYSWYQQCLAVNARDAVAECVKRGAFIGIASHSDVDACWSDKVLPIISQSQFPELESSPRYGSSASTDFSYPDLGDRNNWNCPNCAYHMSPGAHKPNLVASIMTHYGMDPNSAADRARVIFWDDADGNISDVEAAMPEVVSVPVPRHAGGNADDGGCGITSAEINTGWAAIDTLAP